MERATRALLQADLASAEQGISDCDKIAAIATITPGDGILSVGADASAQHALLFAGTRLRSRDTAILRVSGVMRVSVRAPRIRIVLSGKANDPIIASCVEIVTAESTGASVIPEQRQARLAWLASRAK